MLQQVQQWFQFLEPVFGPPGLSQEIRGRRITVFRLATAGVRPHWIVLLVLECGSGEYEPYLDFSLR
ncbi:MAG TPA: hypothetical protein VGH38_29030 [Bryobacteraceae bacterium]